MLLRGRQAPESGGRATGIAAAPTRSKKIRATRDDQARLLRLLSRVRALTIVHVFTSSGRAGARGLTCRETPPRADVSDVGYEVHCCRRPAPCCVAKVTLRQTIPGSSERSVELESNTPIAMRQGRGASLWDELRRYFGRSFVRAAASS